MLKEKGVLKDIRGVNINCKDVVAVTYYDYDKDKASFEITTVEGVNYLRNEIILSDGEPLPLKDFDVIVLPDDYKENFVE